MIDNIVDIVTDFSDLARPFREWLMVDRFARRVIITIMRDGGRLAVLTGRWGGHTIKIATPISVEKMRDLEKALGLRMEDAIAQSLVNEYLSFTTKLVKEKLDGYDRLDSQQIKLAGTIKPELVH